MGNKKNLYNEFCKKSSLIIESIHNNEIQKVIDLLSKEDDNEKIKLLKFSVKNIQKEEKVKEVITMLNIKDYSVIWKSFEFYFQLRSTLKREYFYALNYMLQLNPLFLFFELNKILVDSEEDPQNIIDFINAIFNHNAKNLSRIKRVIYKAKNIKISKQEQVKICFQCYKNYKITNLLLQLFEYDFIDFQYKGRKNVYVINNPKYNLKEMTVADLDNGVILQWQEMILQLNYKKNLFDMNPKEYLKTIENELINAFSINKFLFQDEHIKRVPIKYWLKAFLLIFKENWKCLEYEEKILCKKSKREWCELFNDGGIEGKYHHEIFKELSFLKYSYGKRDIQNYPFIADENYIYTIPGIICSSDIVRVLISIFEESEDNLQFKGEYYEDSIRNKWTRNGIKSIKKKEKISGKEFDCDMAFLFNDDLFICEIKNLSQPNSFHKWHKFYIKLEENLAQLERISNHYSEVRYLEGIIKELSGDKNCIPKKIHSILLYSSYIGNPIKVKETWVASEIDVYNFLTKAPITQLEIVEDNATYYLKYLKNYEYLKDKSHTLTISDFERYMQCPMAIKFQQNRIKIRKQKISIAGVYLFIECIDIVDLDTNFKLQDC